MSNADAERSIVERALARLLADHPPGSCGPRAFRNAQFDHGLAWVWLAEGCGGLGVSRGLQALVDTRLEHAGAPGPEPTMLFRALAGPTIGAFGDADQRRRFLRPMFNGDERWCQLFSEPGAGSDLAGLSCRAVRDGGGWVLDGQKVWTTIAHVADWGMLLARTDPDVPKHEGITFFALDMRLPGVEVRPLRQLTGGARFNEVYLTDVRVADSCRIGAEGGGWSVALAALATERMALGAAAADDRRGPVAALLDLWRSLGEERRTEQRLERVMRLWIRAELLELTKRRAAGTRRSSSAALDGALLKILATELNRDASAAGIDLLGAAGQAGYDYTFRREEAVMEASRDVDARAAFLLSPSSTLVGGTSETLRSVLGERVLGLPPEPRVDKGIAWSRVRRS